MDDFKMIGLVVNQKKEGSGEQAKTVEEFLRNRGLKTRIAKAYHLPEEFFENLDLCITIGGDGTLLSIAAAAAEKNVPVLGINCGKLGFLTAVGRGNWEKYLGEILAGECHILHEFLLECDCDGTKFYALNDVVLKNQDSIRLFGLRTLVDGKLLNEYWADGIIVASPLGSTAYSLSAGGAILAPNVNGLLVTPICPHTLSNRTVILPQKSVIQVKPLEEDALFHLCIDGRDIAGISPEKPISICQSDRSISILQIENYSYYDILRSKLGWK